MNPNYLTRLIELQGKIQDSEGNVRESWINHLLGYISALEVFKDDLINIPLTRIQIAPVAPILDTFRGGENRAMPRLKRNKLILDLTAQGKKPRQIAEELGCTVGTVSAVIFRNKNKYVSRALPVVDLSRKITDDEEPDEDEDIGQSLHMETPRDQSNDQSSSTVIPGWGKCVYKFCPNNKFPVERGKMFEKDGFLFDSIICREKHFGGRSESVEL